MPWARRTALGLAVSTAGLALAAASSPAAAQRLNFSTGVDMTATASSNPDLAPKGQERSDLWLDLSPYFSVSGIAGERVRLTGGGSLGANMRLSLRNEDTVSVSLRPNGALNGTFEVVDNFFFVDTWARVQSSLDNPFLATVEPTSPVNTSTSYQAEITPYVRGRLPGNLDYELRSRNSWTDSPDTSGTYAGRHSARIERAPQPVGGVFLFERSSLDSSREDQPRLITDVARLSLRYAPLAQLAFGVRAGAERYNYTLAANDWQRFYGVEASWRPNDRTRLEGYWEDRVFGSAWQLAFSHRRPRLAFNVSSSRDLSSTPNQFATFPGLANLVSLVDAAFTTRIPDPTERQRAVTDFLSRSQLPSQLLTPTIVYDERITIQENTSATAVVYGERNSLAFTVFRTSTEGIAGFSSLLPVLADNLQLGTELTYRRSMTPVTGFSATASWRRTESLLDADGTYTTQTEIRTELSRRLSQRRDRSTDFVVGARYQWINSAVTHDAHEAAIYATLRYQF